MKIEKVATGINPLAMLENAETKTYLLIDFLAKPTSFALTNLILSVKISTQP